jgi:hypothetical protein
MQMVRAMDTLIPCRILRNMLIHVSILPSDIAMNAPINAINTIGRIRFLAIIHVIINALAKIWAATNVTPAKILPSLGQGYIQFHSHILIEGHKSYNSRGS